MAGRSKRALRPEPESAASRRSVTSESLLAPSLDVPVHVPVCCHLVGRVHLERAQRDIESIVSDGGIVGRVYGYTRAYTHHQPCRRILQSSARTYTLKPPVPRVSYRAPLCAAVACAGQLASASTA